MTAQRQPGKRGKRLARHLPELALSNFIPKIYGAPLLPARADVSAGITDWGLLGNDFASNCVIEGTLVQASDVRRGYRAPYDGPIVKLTTAGGKQLSVTPNHPVLTGEGFALACLVKQGDYLVSGGFMQGADRAVDFHFDHAPTAIEEVCAALGQLAGSRVRTAASPQHFHGDGRFMHGQIDVVAADGFLGRQNDPSLSQPETEQKVIATSKLDGALQSLRPTLQRHQIGRAPSLGGMGSRGVGTALLERHSGVLGDAALTDSSRSDAVLGEQPDEAFVGDPELLGEPHGGLPVLVSAKRLRESFKQQSILLGFSEPSDVSDRAHGYASGLQPTPDGLVTDPELPGELRTCFPGEVTLDRVVKVETDWLSGHVYDLSTTSRWYMADGIVVHNCGPAATGHYRMAKAKLPVGGWQSGFSPWTTEQTLNLYYAYGRAMKEPGIAPDYGVENASWLKFLYDQGVIQGFAEIDVSSPGAADRAHAAMIQFNGCIVGVNLTDDAEQLFAHGQPWTTSNGESPDPNLGHDITLVKYDQNGDTFVTWGALQASTIDWDNECIDECWVMIDQADADRAGVDMEALRQTIDSLGGLETVPPAPPSFWEKVRAFLGCRH